MGNKSSADVNTAQAAHTYHYWPCDGKFIVSRTVPGTNNEHCLCECIDADSAIEIVRAVNAHDELIAACQAAIKWSEDVPSPYRDWEFIQLAKAALAKVEVQS